MDSQVKADSSDKKPCAKQKLDSDAKNNMNVMESPDSSLGTDMPLIHYPSPLECSEPTTEKVPRNKKTGSVIKGKHSRKISCPNLQHFPSPYPNPGSETTSSSTSTSTSTSTSSSTSASASTSTSNSHLLISASKKPDDAKTSDSCNQGNRRSARSDSMDSSTAVSTKRHTGGDGHWEAIQLATPRDQPLGLSHFRLIKRLGYGDIGNVYLVELTGTNTFFAMKVMDKASLVSRNKLLRAQTEKEILSLLDHPFLPTLYGHCETDKYYCLVMEYCSGGNLHSLRQKQPNKFFTEQAARFYVSEVLLALEYVHMLGIVYRDLKPENVLVRDDGHIMLSDFDLSLRCSVNPTLVKSSSVGTDVGMFNGELTIQGCIQPASFFPRILPRRRHSKSKSDFSLTSGAFLELLAEPTNARSMSFVGTHEYLAPEIIRGEGHGSAVDWWTLGIFLFELMYGMTPFKGSGNRATLFNVVDQPLKFPEIPVISSAARDLIRGLLVKDPQRRIAYRRGATEIKQHPFFDGLNWALVRSTTPPSIPEPVDFGQFSKKEATNKEKKTSENSDVKLSSNDTLHLDFEYF